MIRWTVRECSCRRIRNAGPCGLWVALEMTDDDLDAGGAEYFPSWRQAYDYAFRQASARV